MRKLGFFLGAAALAMLGAATAQATNFNVSIIKWADGDMAPADPITDAVAHFQVDDSLMSPTSDSARATVNGTGFGGYTGQLTVDFFEADAGGGFDLIAWPGGQPDYANLANGGENTVEDAPVMYTGTNDAPHLTTGVFTMIGVWGDTGHYQVTISAAQDAPSVPEPASWALMLGGFGLVGGTLRRRRVVFA